MLVHLNYAADSSSDMNLCGADLPESLQPFRGISGLSIHRQIETGHQISTAASGNLGCILFGRFCRRDSKETADSGAAELLSMFGDDLVSGKSLSIKGQFAAIVFCSQLKRVVLITDRSSLD